MPVFVVLTLLFLSADDSSAANAAETSSKFKDSFWDSMGIRESGGGGRGSYAEKPEERTLQPLALIWKEEIP